MDRLRRSLATIRRHLGELSTSQKLLIGSLAVIMVMTLFLVSQYAGRPAMVELLPGAEAADQQKASVALRGAGIRTETRDGRLYVSPADQSPALAMLAEAGQMPSDTTILFSNLAQNQSWTMSRSQQKQVSTIALQNELGAVIRRFNGIREAKVFLDVPEPYGLGQAARRPTAAVGVVMQSGASLSQDQVDKIASLVAGAQAGLAIENVRVIDNNGRQRRPTSEADANPATYMEHAAHVESQTREKLQDLLSYIPGVVVAVTAQVDVTRSTAKTKRHFGKDEGGTVSLLGTERTTEQKSTEGTRAAEPGVRSNQTADISRASGSRSNSFEQTEGEVAMENYVGFREEQSVDPRGMPTFLAASINVPRGYVAGLLELSRPKAEGEAPAAPTEDEIAQKFAEVQKQVEESVLPHLKARAQGGEVVEGEVRVSLVPIEVARGSGVATAGLFGTGGGGLSLGLEGLGGGLIDKVVLLVLACVSLAMMFGIVRRAGKRPALPTAEELVGIPPAIDAPSDLIGEADEGTTAMTGIEVGDDQLRAQALLDQVREIVKKDPGSTAKLVNRWITDVEE